MGQRNGGASPHDGHLCTVSILLRAAAAIFTDISRAGTFHAFVMCQVSDLILRSFCGA